MTKRDIYWRIDQQYARQIVRLEKWDGSQINKDLIIRFKTHLLAKGTKELRLAKIIWGLRHLCDWLGKDLDQATKGDIELLAAKIHQANYILKSSKSQEVRNFSDSTKSDYRRCIKQFYRWFEEEDPRMQSQNAAERADAAKMYKYIEKNIKTKCPEKDHDPSNCITDEEIKTVLSTGCSSDMERAFIKLLHETGCRIGEFLSIRIKDIEKKESCWLVYVNGKTGERRIPFTDSIPYIVRWLDFHPTKDPEDYLWESLNNRYKGKPLEHAGANKLITRCFVRAGLPKKKHNPHWFRHSRATIDAGKYSEPIHCKLRGWVIGSSTPRKYVHLSAKAVEDEFLKARGIKRAKEEEASPLPKTCFCGKINAPEAKYCAGCGKTLHLEAAMQEQEYMTKALEVMEKIMQSPELFKRYQEYMTTRIQESGSP